MASDPVARGLAIAAAAGGGVVGASGFNSVALFQAANVDPTIKQLQVWSYLGAVEGLGAFKARRVNAAPTHPWSFRTQDRFKADGTIDATNGGYWEGYLSGGDFTITVEMFGAVGDGVTDDLTAIQNAIHYAQMVLIGFGKMPIITFEQYQYHCSNTIIIGDSTDHSRWAQVALDGRALHAHMGNPPTKLTFPLDVTGIRIHEGSFAGSRVSGLYIVGVNGNGMTAYGIHMRTNASVKNCRIDNFSTYGIFVESTTGVNEDQFVIDQVAIHNIGLDGLHIDGLDSQTGRITDVFLYNCGGCGIWASAYYNNIYSNIALAGVGLASSQTRTDLPYGCVVTGSDGKEYMVGSRATQASTATTDPATTVNNSVWIQLNTTGSGYPLYVPGRTYGFGAAIFVTEQGSIFNSVYCEVGWCAPSLNASTAALFIGGFGNHVVSNTNAGGGTIDGAFGGVKIDGGLRITGTGTAHTGYAGRTVTFDLGGFGSDASNGVIFSLAASNLTDILDWGITNGQTITWSYGTTVWLEILTLHSTSNWGTGAAITKPQFAFYNGFLLGDNTGTQVACQVYSFSAANFVAPSTVGARLGDIVINNSQAFACSSRGAGYGFRYAYNHVTAANYWQPVKISEVSHYSTMTVANYAALYSPTSGDRGMVSDSNATLAAGLGNIVAGGGANIVPVYFDGTNWRIG